MEAEQGNHEAARTKLKASTLEDPGNRDAKINLANLELEQNNLDQAAHIVERLTVERTRK